MTGTGEFVKPFDPDKTWGVGRWLRHEGCPDALIAGQTAAIHSKAYHRRGPLPGVLHADLSGSSAHPEEAS